MRPMFVKGFTVELQGKMVVVTFENSTRIADVQLTKGMADRLANQIKSMVGSE